MSQPLYAEAGRVRRGAEILTRAAADLRVADPGAHAFAADAPGRLGDLGTRLHGLLRDALDARATEAAAHAQRLEVLAEALGEAAANYAEADRVATQRLAL
jgi:hypothetical protein